MKRVHTLDVRHFAAAIQFLTLAILLYVVLAAPGIAVLHAPVMPIHHDRVTR
ncbi:MAG: hypothetical protein PHT60_14110 [Acidiphilium sp.]|nr:hypothetical protein [Acidiphilium sp.]MDD4936900.1 hypothetical protein [Acidiphilium sp.]